MAATASATRIDVLACPKPIPPGFVADRRSVYWVDRYPPGPGAEGTTVIVATPRVCQLAGSKQRPLYQGDRPTPIWPVSRGAQSANASSRVTELARDRPIHPQYMFDRPVYTFVTKAARSADASGRLVQLSEPKPHKVWANSKDTLQEGEFNEPITAVPLPALSGRSSARVEQLAEHKHPHALYFGNKTVQWPVSENAKHAIASLRLQQLARPKSRGTINDDYDPYKVPLGARNAHASQRIQELCVPIPRKVRAKKVV